MRHPRRYVEVKLLMGNVFQVSGPFDRHCLMRETLFANNRGVPFCSELPGRIIGACCVGRGPQPIATCGGGFSARGGRRVWLAEDRLRPGTLVALKEMPADCPVLPRHEEAFRREFAALASLRHPSVVEAREFDTIGAGAVALAVLKNKPRAQSYFVGATLAGVVPLGWSMLQQQFPQFFADYVSVNYGMLTDVAPMGLLVDECKPNLSDLAAYAMGNEEAYDYVP